MTVPAKQFAETDFYTWNSFAPRIGVVYDLAGNGRTVVKGNYGLYWHNPGAAIGANANPNTANKSATYTWIDANLDQRWQAGEETVRTAAALDGNLTIDPNIKNPYTHEASVWFEQQLTGTMGARAGFVYKTEDDLIATFQPGRPPSAFTVPYAFNDNGVDGRAGTADDRTLTFYGMPNALADQFPITETQMNVDQYSRYKTIEVSMNKRHGSRWSAAAGFAYTMRPTSRTGRKRNANNPGVEDRTSWNFKLSGSYDAPFGIRSVAGRAAPVGLQLRADGDHHGAGGAEPDRDLQRNGRHGRVCRGDGCESRRQHLGVRRPRREDLRARLSRPRARLSRCLQPLEQPRLGNDWPRHRAVVPEADRDPGAVHHARRISFALLIADGLCRGRWPPAFFRLRAPTNATNRKDYRHDRRNTVPLV